MDDSTRSRLDRLAPLLGEWSLEAVFPGAPPSDLRGRVSFEWGPERAFMVERWEVPIAEAPDGVAILAPAEDGEELIQHYFDSRGVTRRYATDLLDGVWTLRKLSSGFAQRFRGELSADGATIAGAWEKADEGSTAWQHDFDLIYRRLG